MFATGMRVGELSALNLDSVNLAENTVTVRGKGNRERILPLSSNTGINIVGEYLKLRNKQMSCSEALFLNSRKVRLSEQSIRRILSRHAPSSMKRITPHMIRHTVATLLLEQGVDLRYIQALLGHSSMMTTVIYAHATPSATRKIISEKHPRNLMSF
jgi:integrase/recombinase XerD